MPITRTSWIDDDGSGTTGSIINNAEKTILYNQIDTACAFVNAPNTFTGSQVITGTVAGDHTVSITNQMSDPLARSFLDISAGTTHAYAMAFSQGYTTNGVINIASTMLLYTTAAGGLSVCAGAAAGAIRFYTGAAPTLQLTIPATGNMEAAGQYKSLSTFPFNGVNAGSSAGTVAVFDAGGNLLKQTSSARFKDHVHPWTVDPATLDRFVALSPKRWDYTGQPTGAAGFIAEDLDALTPNADGRSLLLNYDRDGRPESNRDFAVIALQHLVLQQHAARLAALERLIEETLLS